MDQCIRHVLKLSIEWLDRLHAVGLDARYFRVVTGHSLSGLGPYTTIYELNEIERKISDIENAVHIL